MIGSEGTAIALLAQKRSYSMKGLDKLVPTKETRRDYRPKADTMPKGEH